MIRSWLLACIMLPLLMLAGCGVDKSRVQAQVAQLEQHAAQLAQFIQVNEPILAQLHEVAASTGDPALVNAAAKVAAAVDAARKALPPVQTAIAETKAHLATLEADAEGKVDWWAMLYPIALFALKFVPVVGQPLADGIGGVIAAKKRTPTPAKV